VITMPDKKLQTNSVSSEKSSLSKIIYDLQNAGLSHGNKSMICSMVLDSMKEHGCFIKCEGSSFYLDNETGTLVKLCKKSRDLPAFLSINFKLNSDDRVVKRVMEEIRNHSHNFSEKTELHSFATYKHADNTLYLDAFENKVWKIIADSTPELVQAGTDTAIFIENPEFSQWKYIEASERDERKNIRTLFFDLLPIQNEADRESFIVLLDVYSLAIALPELVPSRPLLVFTGEKGSGKSTSMRCFGQILFGKEFEVTANINDPKDLETALVSTPFVALDNVDGSISKILDLIATASTGGTFKRRKLYSDDTLYNRRARAFIGLTSREPRFKRDDLNSRVFRVPFKSIENRRAQSTIEREILSSRDQLMSERTDLCSKVLKELKASEGKTITVNMRMADFGIFAIRIAPALGITAKEMREHLKVMNKDQQLFAAENDPFLELLADWLESDTLWYNKPYTPTKLHNHLRDHSEKYGIKYFCKSPSSMGKKIKQHHEYLSEHFRFRKEDIPKNSHLYYFEMGLEDET